MALFLTYLLLRVTRKDQQALRVDQRRAQATKVSAWCEQVDLAEGSNPDKVIVRLRNASDEPIYGARVAVGADWWNNPPKYVETELGYVVAPHYDRPHVVELRVGRAAAGLPETSPPVEVIFADAGGGRFWHRDRYGGLSEITSETPPAGRDYFFTTPANLLPPARKRARRPGSGPNRTGLRQHSGSQPP